MPLGPVLAALAATASSFAWSLWLIAEPAPFAKGPAVVLALSLITMTLIALSGLLLTRGRWALWLLIAIAGTQVALAITTPLVGRWVAVATIVAFTPAMVAAATGRDWLRRSSEGPPPLAVVLLLLLIAFPALVAASNADGISVAAVLGSALTVLAAVLYARAGLMALWVMRALVPVGAFAAGATTPLPAAAAVLVAGAGLSVLCWSPIIRNAAAPLAPLRSPGYKIPPELAPPEILDAAGLDEGGHRL